MAVVVVGGSMALATAVALSRSITMRGPLIMAARVDPKILSSGSKSFLHSGSRSHPGMASFDPNTTGAAMIANSVPFTRSAQLERHLNPKPWDAKRLLSTSPVVAASGSPNPASFFVQVIESVIAFFASLLPSKAVMEAVEAEVDAAAAMVEQGAQIVVDIADKVEELANAAELGAEEVEKIAKKVEDLTKKIQKIVDDVADVLEGEKGASTLVQAVEQLRTVAASKRAKEADTTAAATTSTVLSQEKPGEAVPISTNPQEK